MPSLDTQKPSDHWASPWATEISPWEALGPLTRAPLYLAAMRHASYLRLVGVVLRLEPNDDDTEGAAKQWEDIFGIVRRKDLVCYTNAKMGFVAGLEGQPAGIHSITIAVEGKERMDRMLWAAREEGVCGYNWVDMVGVRWFFVEAGTSDAQGK
jgi:hypothetical protein